MMIYSSSDHGWEVERQLKSAKMKDVALAAKVSTATVTRVINNSGYVSADTRAKVELEIERLEYIPNRMAGILKSHNSGIIGNIMPSYSGNPLFSQISASISKHARSIGRHILDMISEDDPVREKELLDDLFGRMADGIILSGGVNSNPKDIQAIINKGTPVIMIERPLIVHGADKVLIDSYEGAMLAAKHIIAKGHKRIGFIGRALEGRVEIDRFNGFMDTLRQNDLAMEPSHCVLSERYSAELGYMAMHTIMQNRNRPTVILLTSDITAYGALQYLYEQGIRIPDDVSIVGYDNTFSAVTSPAVTSVAFPIDEIGKTVVQLFSERKQDGRKTAKSVLLSPYLKDRDSVLSLL